MRKKSQRQILILALILLWLAVAAFCLTQYKRVRSLSWYVPPSRTKVANVNVPVFDEKANQFVQKIEECSCNRTYHYSPYRGAILSSTCSDDASRYESRQNVVAYSLYLADHGKPLQKLKKAYARGIRLNLESIRKFLPGFVIRIYTSVPLEGEGDFCDIVCKNPDVFWCSIFDVPNFGDLSSMFFMTWRFLPVGDRTVDVFLSRDLDSVISQREAATIKDWLTINKPFHVLRDRRFSHNTPMLGGLWGARNSLLGKNAKMLQTELIKESISKRRTRRKKGGDQIVLHKVIYSNMLYDIVAYDSYHCKTHRQETLVRPFPMQRINANDFVGNPLLGGGQWEAQPCPVECRPIYGRHWTYC